MRNKIAFIVYNSLFSFTYILRVCLYFQLYFFFGGGGGGGICLVFSTFLFLIEMY